MARFQVAEGATMGFVNRLKILLWKSSCVGSKFFKDDLLHHDNDCDRINWSIILRSCVVKVNS